MRLFNTYPLFRTVLIVLVSFGLLFLASLFLPSALFGSILLISAAVVVGLILERIDSSRKPRSHRSPPREDGPEDFWGFHGRPGG